MAKTITQLPAGTAQGNSVVAADNPTGTATEKVTLASIAAIGGGIPGSHASHHATTGSDPIAPGDIGAATISHIHDASVIVSGTLSDARLSANVVQASDSRLSDARTPTAHTHSASDIVSGTVASARLGSGTASSSTFLRGDGAWASSTSTTATTLPFSLAGTTVLQLGTTSSTHKGRFYGEAYGEPWGIGARHTTGGGAVYFGAADATATPSAQISNNIGVALMTLTDGGAVSIPGSLSVAGSAVVVTSDSRLTNSRTPTAHVHSAADITSGTLADARLSSNVPLLVGGYLPASILPSFVDDVLEYSALASFPATGETGKIFVDTTTKKIYRWSGSAYIEISPSPGTTTDVPEGTNLYFTTARASAAAPVQSVNSKVGSVVLTAADVGASAPGHSHSASDITSGYIAPARLGSGTADSTTFLRGDGTWQVGTGGSGSGITQADADVRYVNAAGDSMTGSLSISQNAGNTYLVSLVNGASYTYLNGGTYTSGRFGPRPVNDGYCTMIYSWDTVASNNYWSMDYSSTAVAFSLSTAGTSSTKVTFGSTGGITATGQIAGATCVSTGGRSLFTAVSEAYAVGSRYSSTGGYVYFGATDSTATPGMQISNAGGGAMLSCTNAGAVSVPGSLSVAGNAVVVTNDARLSDSRNPTSHSHGNITNAGAIGTTSGLPIITTTSGVLTAGSFGSTAGSFCQGNDSRLSDARTPLTHTHAATDIVSGTLDVARLPASVVLTTDSRLSDSRTPLAHTQAATTITGLATVATSGSYADLTNQPTAMTLGRVFALS